MILGRQKTHSCLDNFAYPSLFFFLDAIMKQVISILSSFNITTLSYSLTFTTFFLEVNVGNLRFAIASHMYLSSSSLSIRKVSYSSSPSISRFKSHFASIGGSTVLLMML